MAKAVKARSEARLPQLQERLSALHRKEMMRCAGGVGPARDDHESYCTLYPPLICRASPRTCIKSTAPPYLLIHCLPGCCP